MVTSVDVPVAKAAMNMEILTLDAMNVLRTLIVGETEPVRTINVLILANKLTVATMQNVKSKIINLIVCVRLATLVIPLPAPGGNVLLTRIVAILKLVLIEFVKIHVFLVHVEIMHTAR